MLQHLLLCASLLPLVVFSQVPDPDFGVNGIVIEDAGKSDVLRDLALQSDGKIVAAGWTYDASSTDLLVARFNVDGSLDAGFGTGGVVVRPTGSEYSGAEAVAIQPDGKILVAGYSNNGVTNGFTVWRLNTDGTDDTDFGTGGQHFDLVFSGGSFINAMCLDPITGKILVTGPAYFGGLAWVGVQRLNSNGTPDVDLNGTGTFTYTSGAGSEWVPTCIDQLADGRIVLGGSTNAGGTWDAMMMRLLSGGTLDPDLDGDGIRTVNGFTGADEYIYNLVLRPDGRYILTGEALPFADYDVYMVQLADDGSNSSFFGTNAWAANHGASEYCRGSLLRPDGKLLHANSVSSAGGSVADLWQTTDFTSGEGSDAGFGVDGWYDIDPGDWTYVEAMVQQTDGLVLIAGNTASGGQPYDMFLARYDVGLDPTNVEAHSHQTGITLFPNPGDGRFSIQGGTARVDRLEVIDARGRVVLSHEDLPGLTEIDLTGMPSGLYAVRCIEAGKVTNLPLIKL